MMKREKATLNLAIGNDGTAGAKVAAAIYYGNQLISVGYNSRKTHPLQKKYGKNGHAIHLHAEIDAIRRAVKVLPSLDGCDIFIARVKRPSKLSKNWIPGTAKPCIGCQRAIYAFGLRRIYYTEDDTTEYTKETT